MASTRDVLAAISLVRAQLIRTITTTRHGLNLLASAEAAIAEATHDATSPSATAAGALLHTAVRLGEQATAHTHAGDHHLAAYQAIVAGHTTGDNTPARPTPARAASPAQRPAARFDPAKAAEIRPLTGHPKTIGRLYDADGHPVAELIYSGKDGPGAGAPGLHGRWRLLESLTEHTEGHAAALIRMCRSPEATLYLNRYPCPGPAGCFTNIAAALPAGTRLTIWVVNSDGSTVRVQRTGTGEALRP